MMKLIEKVQYQAALICTGCWKGTNRQKLYDELGWESLEDRRIFRRFLHYDKINTNLTPALVHWDKFDSNITAANTVYEFKNRYFSTFEIKHQKCDTFDVRDR